MFLLLGGKDFWHHFSTHLSHDPLLTMVTARLTDACQ